MRTQGSTTAPSSAIRNGALVLSGYGLKVFVERGHLVCSDGYCDVRRRIRLHRAMCGLRRLVLLGYTGYISLEALRWLHGIGASVVQIGPLGEPILACGPRGLDDARIRRAQAIAVRSETGLRITSELLCAKLLGQASVLDTLGAARLALTIRGSADALDRVGTLTHARLIEADCGARYWDALKDVRMSFARRDERLVPDHWKTLGPRSSPLTGQPRLAATPAHAMWNYLYAALETGARIACQTAGLDPGVGILHTDQPGRDSMALDLMEPARHKVDAFVLDLLRQRGFSRDDFEEDRRGVCRVCPPLTRHLAETGSRWMQEIAPWAERVASLLMADASNRRRRPDRTPTPLTQANRSAGRDAVRRRLSRVAQLSPFSMPNACRSCGVLLEGKPSDRLYCDDCLPARKAFMFASGQAVLKWLRAEGRDPAHSPAAIRTQEGTRARHRAAAHAWERTHAAPPNPKDFTRMILPLLSRVSLGRMARATGLSKGYLSFVRRGLHVPHPRHWDVLRRLATQNGGEAMDHR